MTSDQPTERGYQKLEGSETKQINFYDRSENYEPSAFIWKVVPGENAKKADAFIIPYRTTIKLDADGKTLKQSYEGQWQTIIDAPTIYEPFKEGEKLGGTGVDKSRLENHIFATYKRYNPLHVPAPSSLIDTLGDKEWSPFKPEYLWDPNNLLSRYTIPKIDTQNSVLQLAPQSKRRN